MKIAKKLLAMTIVLAMMLGLTSTALLANDDVQLVADGQTVQFADQGPVYVDGRVIVPVYGVFSHFGFDVSWDANTREATITGDITVVIPAEGARIYVDGAPVEPIIPQLILQGRLMLPLATIAEVLGVTAAWNPAERVATLTTVVEEPAAEEYEEPADEDEYVEEYEEPADNEEYTEEYEEPADAEDYDDEDEEPADAEEYDEDEEPADEEDNANNVADTNSLVGTWSWDATGTVYYVLNADGTGTMAGMNIYWTVSNGVFAVCVTPDLCGDVCIAPMEWYYELDGNNLTLTSTVIPDMVYHYSR